MGEHYWIALEDGERFCGLFSSSEAAIAAISEKVEAYDTAQSDADVVRLVTSSISGMGRLITILRVPMGEFLWERLPVVEATHVELVRVRSGADMVWQTRVVRGEGSG